MSAPRLPYVLVRTAFHGGGALSHHRDEVTADRAQRRYRSRECSCGCSVVIATADYLDLPVASEARGPYCAARP